MTDEELTERIRIAAGLTSLSSVQTEQIGQWLGDLRALIAARFDLLDTGSLDQSRLAYVLTEVIAKRVKRPDAGVTADEVAVDDARTVRRYERSSGGFDITDEMWALLAPVRRARGAFTITPTYQPDVRRAW